MPGAVIEKEKPARCVNQPRRWGGNSTGLLRARYADPALAPLRTAPTDGPSAARALLCGAGALGVR